MSIRSRCATVESVSHAWARVTRLLCWMANRISNRINSIRGVEVEMPLCHHRHRHRIIVETIFSAKFIARCSQLVWWAQRNGQICDDKWQSRRRFRKRRNGELMLCQKRNAERRTEGIVELERAERSRNHSWWVTWQAKESNTLLDFCQFFFALSRWVAARER